MPGGTNLAGIQGFQLYATQAFYAPPGKKDERYTMQAYIQTQADKFKEAVEGMNELLNELPESEVFLLPKRRSRMASKRIVPKGTISCSVTWPHNCAALITTIVNIPTKKRQALLTMT